MRRLWSALIRLVGEVLPVILLLVVTVVITADVVARTVFNRPVFAASDIGLIAFIWLVWLGAAAVASRNEMMGISYFVDRLGPLKRPAMILSDVLVIAISVFGVYATFRQISTARFTVFDSMPLPKWTLVVGVGISFVLMTLIYAVKIYSTVRGRSPEQVSHEDPL